MMCQRIGLPPISTIGFGRVAVSSLRRVPRPPARMTAFIGEPSRQNYAAAEHTNASEKNLLSGKPDSTRSCLAPWIILSDPHA